MEYQVIITARKGSKRFPGKNIAPLNGKPLIAYSIEYALIFFSKELIWVNTNDPQVIDIANKYQVQITIRPDYLGSDTTSSADVLSYQCSEFLRLGIKFDACILLQPTNPIRPQNLINESILIFEKSNRRSLTTFSTLNKKYGRIINERFKTLNYIPGQRMQDIKVDYFENGLLYITKKEDLLLGYIVTEDVYPLIVNTVESLIDIDEPKDLIFAESLINLIAT